MDRLEIIQRIMAARRFKRYLEIGVADGRVFHSVQARHKVAVDPAMPLDKALRKKACLQHPWNLFNGYHKVTSDEYFAALASRQSREFFNLNFIDGLHTYEQCLRDCQNALRHLAPGGVILMHDCNPQSAATAWPAKSLADAARQEPEGWNGEWCGDVWKTVVHLRARHLRVCEWKARDPPR